MAFTAIPHVKSWTVNPSAELHAIGTSGTAGWKNRVTGTADWTASVVCAAQGAGPPLAEGDSATLQLWENGSQYWTGAAVVESIESEADRDSGAPVLYTINFGGNGALSETGGSGSTLIGSIAADAKWGTA